MSNIKGVGVERSFTQSKLSRSDRGGFDVVRGDICAAIFFCKCKCLTVFGATTILAAVVFYSGRTFKFHLLHVPVLLKYRVLWCKGSKYLAFNEDYRVENVKLPTLIIQDFKIYCLV